MRWPDYLSLDLSLPDWPAAQPLRTAPAGTGPAEGL